MQTVLCFHKRAQDVTLSVDPAHHLDTLLGRAFRDLDELPGRNCRDKRGTVRPRVCHVVECDELVDPVRGRATGHRQTNEEDVIGEHREQRGVQRRLQLALPRVEAAPIHCFGKDVGEDVVWVFVLPHLRLEELLEESVSSLAQQRGLDELAARFQRKSVVVADDLPRHTRG